MRLIAKKPCSFGGHRFFIGDEIPEGFVADAKMQEVYGVIAIVNENAGEGASGGQPGALFTQEQTDSMIAAAVDEAVKNVTAELEQERLQQLEELQKETAELKVADGFASFDGTVIISIKGESDGENGPATAIPATPEEIQEAFSIMQMNAEDGARAVAEVSSENVLILLHAADSRKGIKAAARKQAEALFGDGNPDSGMENKNRDEKSKDGEEGDGG